MRAVEAFWLCGECAREFTLDWTEGEMRVVRRAEVLEEVEASQKSEVRSQKSEVRSQKSEVRSQKSEVRSQIPLLGALVRPVRQTNCRSLARCARS